MIRPAQPSDVAAIAAIFHRTVKEVNAGDYTPAQIQAWAGEAPDPGKWLARLAQKMTFVCERDGEVVGFAEFEETGHIDAVYVHADHQGKGVATELLGQIETEADRRGIVRLFTEASITARPFFEARGFTVVARQEVEYRGSRFINFRMERQEPAGRLEPK
jgi:putative acetyltransferase